jgi:hypothetical protein
MRAIFLLPAMAKPSLSAVSIVSPIGRPGRRRFLLTMVESLSLNCAPGPREPVESEALDELRDEASGVRIGECLHRAGLPVVA